MEVHKYSKWKWKIGYIFKWWLVWSLLLLLNVWVNSTFRNFVIREFFSWRNVIQSTRTRTLTLRAKLIFSLFVESLRGSRRTLNRRRSDNDSREQRVRLAWKKLSKIRGSASKIANSRTWTSEFNISHSIVSSCAMLSSREQKNPLDSHKHCLQT